MLSSKLILYSFILLSLPAFTSNSWHPLRNVPGSALPSCGWGTELLGACSPESEDLRRLASQLEPVTDKVAVHVYHLMYGIFLHPLRNSAPFKFLEIGLGCDMIYGAGASAKLWRRLLEKAELWEADVNRGCVQAHTESLQRAQIKALSGDQGNATDVRRWIRQSGGQFHAVVDDGGHRNFMILISFALLWREVLPGGLYAIEDLQAGRMFRSDGGQTTRQMVVSDVVQAWLEELVVGFPSCDPTARRTTNPLVGSELWRLPRGVQWIFCQPEACLLRKAAATPPPRLQLPDLFVQLLRPLQNASFRPRLLLAGLPCTDRGHALRQWRAHLPAAAITLLNPEDSCEGVAPPPVTQLETQRVRSEELPNWVGGLDSRFDVVVDCSNGTDSHMLETHAGLWRALKGAGLYLLPHLQGRTPVATPITVIAVLQAWVDSLLIGHLKYHPGSRPALPSAHNPWRPPMDLLFVGCEGGACALGRWPFVTGKVVNYMPWSPMAEKRISKTLVEKRIGLRYTPAARCY